MEKDAFLNFVKAGDPITADLFNRIITAIGKDFGGGGTANGQGLTMAYMMTEATAASGPNPTRFEVRYAVPPLTDTGPAQADTDSFRQYAFNFYNQAVPLGASKARLCWLSNHCLVVADCVEFDASLLD